jgi:hypothetical protein
MRAKSKEINRKKLNFSQSKNSHPSDQLKQPQVVNQGVFDFSQRSTMIQGVTGPNQVFHKKQKSDASQGLDLNEMGLN